MTVAASPLAGFWMGGYEGADHVNSLGHPLDMAHASGHVTRLEEDHRRAAQAGLSGVRESIGWRLAEAPGGAIDLSRTLRVQASARRFGLQPIWTLMHYGVPADLSLHDDALVPRLVRFAAQVARVLAAGSEAPPIYNVVNEISYLAWAACGDGMLAAPANGKRSTGYDIKRRLARAALLAMRAMREEDPRARFINVEPLVHVVAPAGRPDLQARAELERSWQWQAWDMLAGRLEPELGGAPQWLDLVGVNHYHIGQWEAETGERLHWHLRDPRRMPLNKLLQETWQRYGAPVVVAETSHVGIGRAQWLHEVAAEVRTARAQGVPVQGVCLYPLIDRPDWQARTEWHRSGLWHVDQRPAAPCIGGEHPRRLSRHAEPEVMLALRQWQAAMPGCGPAGTRLAPLHRARALLAWSAQPWSAGRHRTRQLLQGLVRRHPGWRLAWVEFADQQPPGPRPADAPTGWLDAQAVAPNIDLLVLHGFGRGTNARLAQAALLLLTKWLAAQGMRAHVAWLDTPGAWPMARALGPTRVVYDEGDDANDRSAAAALPNLRQDLRARADLLLTASPPGTSTLGRRGAARATPVPTGIDAAGFRRLAGRPGNWAHEEVRALLPRIGGRPVLGHAASVDPGTDLPLIAALAAARPEWQFVMPGRVVGLERGALPRADNIHWLDDLPHELVPALMAQWQLGILPRLPPWNAGEACTGPALECLASGLQLVSSVAVPVHLAAAGVHQAHGLGGWLAACERALAEGEAPRRLRLAHGRTLLRRSSWHRSVVLCEGMLLGLDALGGRASAQREIGQRAASRAA